MPQNSRVDVAALQVEIEQRAREAGAEPAFPRLHLRQLVPILREAVKVEPSPPLIGRTLYERLWVAINSSIRRGARHAVEPAVAAQNAFNDGVQRSLERLMAGDAALHAEIVRLRAESKHAEP